jgi:hypothetical protein
VLQQQSALTSARSNLVGAKTAYEKSRVEQDRATGLLLEHNNIDLADAQTGVVTKMPAVPYVVPRTASQSLVPPDQSRPSSPDPAKPNN